MSKLNNSLISLLEKLLNESDDKFNIVLRQYKNSKDKVKQLVAKLYMDHAIDGMLDYNQVYMTTIIDDFNKNLSDELNKIGTLEILTTTAILGEAFTNSYYKTAFTLQQSVGVSINFDKVNESILNEFINQNWSGKHFSERIWTNQQALREALSFNLERGIREGQKLDKIAKEFDKQFNSKAYQSQRLVRTETAKIIQDSRDKIYEENGITQVQWLATLDDVTSDICSELDGQIFDIDNKPDCPAHPNCRSTLVPVIEIGTNVRKDNETKEYIPYATYREWEKANGI
ncbi:MAG: minor capsid protein [Bacillaceae bacterium]|nr:minor capsid protein [Bacillaceae bacterium]